MVDIPRPIVPLVHANEAEHRRLLALRANAAMTRDGSAAMTAPLRLVSYTVATLPDATLWTGALVFVSDGAAGQKLRYSDGSAWVIAG